MSSDPDRDDMLAFQQNGDRTALESLWRRHADDAWRLTRWICGDRAEDALQEAAVHLVQAASRCRDGEPGSTAMPMLKNPWSFEGALRANNRRIM